MQPIISVQTSATHLNSILNHPEVHVWVARDSEPLDITPIIDDPNWVFLSGEYGGQAYRRLQPGIFEAHSAFVPEGRGEWALQATHQSLKWIFTRTEAVEIVTRCPVGNVGAKALARAIGGIHDCTVPHGWVKCGKPIAADIYSLTIQGWMKTAPSLPERGRWFHDRLETELARLGIEEPPHEASEVHDRYVGAAVEMCFGNQPGKAQVFYNRIAALAGWHPISIPRLDPLTVDIGSATLVMRGDDFYVVPPQQSTQ